MVAVAPAVLVERRRKDLAARIPVLPKDAGDDAGAARLRQANDRDQRPVVRTYTLVESGPAPLLGRPSAVVRLLAVARRPHVPATGRLAGAGRGDEKVPDTGAARRSIVALVVAVMA